MTGPDTLSIEQRGICAVLSGELDILSGPRMAVSLMRLANRAQRLELDLSGVTFMDACGLRSLLWLKRALPTLRVVAVSPRVERVLMMTETYVLLADVQLEHAS